MGAHFLVIEDDPEFADYLRRGLTYEGHQVQVAASAEAGLDMLCYPQPDLVILDVMLPGMDGMATCRMLRQIDYLGPILMLTARNGVGDRVAGLNAGADDYLGKPFDFDELSARIRALLRRQGTLQATLNFADLELDTTLYAARRQGKTTPLSRTEYDLLALFMAYPEQVLSRDVILGRVWPDMYDCHTNVLDVYISRLRCKIGSPPLIHTLYGVGYILKTEGI
jgi:two-component system response regulator MprA